MLAALLVAFSAIAWAQSSTATLNGTLTDEAGAVVSGATVTLTQIATGQTRTAVSSNSGFYTFPQVKPDKYRLKVERQGFALLVREEVLLQVGDTVVLDLALKVGGVGETITVTGNAAPLLETGSSSLGEVVNSRTIESLPLNGRNTMQLVALTPGVSTTRSYRTSTFGSGAIQSNAFSANGGRNVANEIMVDGSPQVVMGYNQRAWVPNPDATQEFKVQTNGLSAEYGRTGGAVVNLVTRSGTNEFHGTLFEFVRNDLFDANGFFNNLNARAKAPFRFNQFGGTVGGPVWVPRVYNGKNKTFFFTNGDDGLLALIGQSINAQVRSDCVPYSAQWNLNLQYELPSQMLVDVAYAGNAGVKLLANAQLNQLTDDKLALGAQLNAVVNNPFFGVFSATSPLGARTTTLQGFPSQQL
ncbi:MAG: TonB-dependent receptor [Acidobacteria bacterium]|nr:TonB-dependent receptor [Acidobacteriota bacterium]